MSRSFDVSGLPCLVAGDGEPLLLVHAGVADMRMWDPQVADLKARHRVIRYDLRGFGGSTVPLGPYCHHEDARSVLEAAGGGAVHVVGASFGAAVALDLALACPDQVRSLVLVSPVVGGWEPKSQTLLTFFAEEREALERGDLEYATELNLRVWVDGPGRTPDPERASVRELVRQMQRRAFTVHRPDGAREVELDPPAWGRLGEIRVPCLIITGDRDLEELGVVARHVGAGIAGSRIVVIAGTGHLPSLEAPEEFNRILRGFLASLES